MRLSAVPIITWCNVNDFTTGNQWIIRQGDPNTLYYQLVDLDHNSSRYIAGVGTANQPASMTVTFSSIDDDQIVQIPATQDPNDGSIWAFNISPTQHIFGGNVKFSLTEGSATRTFFVMNMMAVENTNNPGCDCAIPDSNVFSYGG